MELKDGQELEFEDGKRYIVRVDGEGFVTIQMPMECRINRHALMKPLQSPFCSVPCMAHHSCMHDHLLHSYITLPRGIVNLHLCQGLRRG